VSLVLFVSISDETNVTEPEAAKPVEQDTSDQVNHCVLTKGENKAHPTL